MASTLAIYMGLFLIGTFVLAFAVLPLALTAIVPAGTRELLDELQPAFVLALVTTLPTSALPLIQGVAERRIPAAGHGDDEAKDITRATISLSYVFTSLGNYFVALFIIYAAQHYQGHGTPQKARPDALSRFDPTHPAQRRKSQSPRYLAKFHRCHLPGTRGCPRRRLLRT